MPDGHTCYHCKTFVPAGQAHDCWTTTETALIADLSDELREAWERLREAAVALGEQRIYASHNSIMFARRTCYGFVRPKRSFLELNVFLNRTIAAPEVRRVVRASATRVVHVVPIRHRDEVEPPITDWLAEAYALQDAPANRPTRTTPRRGTPEGGPSRSKRPPARQRRRSR
jgi:Domain of unknown function (DUF5655)